MKPVKIKYKDLSDKQRESILILIEWFNMLYEENTFDKKYFLLWKYLMDIVKLNKTLTATDMETLRELWDTYVGWKQIRRNDA